MKISVVMCTYNGEKYILEQLESIYDQSLQPDEVIIQDDQSIDSTVSIISDFITSHGLDNSWNLSVNDSNLGWKSNFMDAVTKASGDIIFLSDQDDIWDKRKIEIMSGVYADNPDIELLVCNHEPYDTVTNRKAYFYQPKYGNELVTKVGMTGSFTECGRPGCTYALSSKLIQYIDSIWETDWPHDQYFWCVAIVRGTLYSCNKPLIRFRRHEGTSTPSNEKESARRANIIKKDLMIMNKLLDNKVKIGIPQENWRIMENSAIIYRVREKAIRDHNVLKLLSLVPKMDYYPRPKGWLGDIVASLR